MLDLEFLAALAEQHRNELPQRVRDIRAGGYVIPLSARPALMGVVNLSPDSWYRESVSLTTDRAIQRGLVIRAQGADLVDVGAESSLANAARVDAELQQSRLLPVIRGLRDAGVAVSVETYDRSVARAGFEAGAVVLNLTGATDQRAMFELARDFGGAVIVCYVQGEHVRAVGDFDFGADPVEKMYDYFARAVDLAASCGLAQVMIDPGMGFYYRNLQDSAVRVRHQMRVFLNSFRLRRLGVPICHALPHAFEYFGEEVRCAEPFFAVLAALGKTDLFRTHEVPRVKAVLDTLSAF
jgi:dihydropteroate synthase